MIFGSQNHIQEYLLTFYDHRDTKHFWFKKNNFAKTVHKMCAPGFSSFGELVKTPVPSDITKTFFD